MLQMSCKIALVGNPNSGKTTLFNVLTGANQSVGNWPGVTVEKKEGKLKSNKEISIIDLPGIYSLSPYTLEEVVSRNYLLNEKPDCMINIVDGTNLERNLYLTTQLIELSIPVVVAVNMMDIVQKNGDIIETKKLEEAFGCPFVEISAMKSNGIDNLLNKVIQVAKKKGEKRVAIFNDSVERILAQIESSLEGKVPVNEERWYAIKLFERDEKVLSNIKIEKIFWQK
mgnify:FL=1